MPSTDRLREALGAMFGATFSASRSRPSRFAAARGGFIPHPSRDTARAMSEENFKILREASKTFNEEGAEAAARRFFAEDVEFHEPPEQPAPRVARGREEALRLFQAFDETWEDHRSDIEELRAIGADKVLAFSVERFTGRDGIELAAPAAAIFTLREGKIVRWETFWDRASALEAAGLSE